jgi:tRNA(fMet)-specific endonuclease VapC
VSLRYLLDTNILSEPLRLRPNPHVMARLRRHDKELTTATTVLHELLFGCYRLPASKKRETIEQYLNHIIQSNITFLPYDANAATWHASERARLIALGQTPPFSDGQIAAIAKTNSLILVTRNISDYQNFTDLQVENWYDNSNE